MIGPVIRFQNQTNRLFIGKRSIGKPAVLRHKRQLQGVYTEHSQKEADEKQSALRSDDADSDADDETKSGKKPHLVRNNPRGDRAPSILPGWEERVPERDCGIEKYYCGKTKDDGERIKAFLRCLQGTIYKGGKS